ARNSSRRRRRPVIVSSPSRRITMGQFKPKAATRLGTARTALVDTGEKIKTAEAALDKALLADDDAIAMRLDSELETLRREARMLRSKVQVLEGEAAREEQAAVVKRKQEQILRIERKLNERDAVAAELQRHLGAAEQAFRKVIELSEQVLPTWSFASADIAAGLLTGPTLTTAVATELFRIGARPRLLGGQEEKYEVDFPGGRCPDHRLLGLPKQLPELSASLRQATQYISDLIRGKRTTGGPVVQAPALNGKPVSAPMPTAAPSVPDAAPPARDLPPASRLSELLAQQAQLALDV